MKLIYRAAERDGGRRVYHVLRNELHVSAEGIKRLKSADAVTADGRPVHMDYRLTPGETVEADLSLAEPAPDFPAERGELDILLENDAYLAVNKPAGMLTHPSRSQYTGTLMNLASGYLLDTAGTPAVHAVNRLDRDTSGAVLFAKSAHAKALAVNALGAPGAEKVYLAYLCGRLPGDQGVIDLPIAREREGLQKRVVSDAGKCALTEYETLDRTEIDGQAVTYVRLSLKTGRTHQIRVHCAHLGCPVLGDALYANDISRALNVALSLSAHLLHARRLAFRDPLTGTNLALTAPVKRLDMLNIHNFFENNS